MYLKFNSIWFLLFTFCIFQQTHEGGKKARCSNINIIRRTCFQSYKNFNMRPFTKLISSSLQLTFSVLCLDTSGTFSFCPLQKKIQLRKSSSLQLTFSVLCLNTSFSFHPLQKKIQLRKSS